MSCNRRIALQTSVRVHHRTDFDIAFMDAVDHEVRGSGDNELAQAAVTGCGRNLWEAFHQRHRFQNALADAARGGWALFRQERDCPVEITLRRVLPNDWH